MPRESELMTSCHEEKCYIFESYCFKLDDNGVKGRKTGERRPVTSLPKTLDEKVTLVPCIPFIRAPRCSTL